MNKFHPGGSRKETAVVPAKRTVRLVCKFGGREVSFGREDGISRLFALAVHGQLVRRITEGKRTFSVIL